MTLRALTLRQPWAWAVAHAGKRIENRTWRPPASLVGSWFLIHAGKALDSAAVASLAERGIVVPSDVERGAFVAVARCGGWVTQSSDPWFLGPFGWVLTEVIPLPEPIPCRGRQGVWFPPPEVAYTVGRMIHVTQQKAPYPDAPNQEGQA